MITFKTVNSRLTVGHVFVETALSSKKAKSLLTTDGNSHRLNMKRILTTMAIGLIATGVFAQGTIYTLNGTGYLAISTNGTWYGRGAGVTQGTGIHLCAL
jgi:hypothetical protein